MAFTGDIMMHIPVKSSARAHNEVDVGTNISHNNSGFDFLFERIRESLKVSEIVIGNMEFPVSPPFKSIPKIFNCHPDVLPAMKKAGFTILHIANNHILDQGEKGIISTMHYIAKSGVDFLGIGPDERTARAGIVKNLGGIRVGFIGYAGYLNYARSRRQIGYRLNWFYDESDVKSDIADIRKRSDFLVMVAHTGVEYASMPHPKDIALMKSYINQGVDLIICHHPHLLQPVEKVVSSDGRECHIFYSLGNFLSNQDAKERLYVNGVPVTTRDSIIVRCMLSQDAVSGKPRARFQVLPIQTINEAGRRGRVIQTVSLPGERENLKKRLIHADEKEKVDINRRIGDLNQKSEAIKALVLKYYKDGEIDYIE